MRIILLHAQSGGAGYLALCPPDINNWISDTDPKIKSRIQIPIKSWFRIPDFYQGQDPDPLQGQELDPDFGQGQESVPDPYRGQERDLDPYQGQELDPDFYQGQASGSGSLSRSRA